MGDLLVWDNLAFGPRARHDVVFCPSFSRPLIARSRPVVTIHEATYRLHPELLPRRGRLALPRLYLRLYGWSGRAGVDIRGLAESLGVGDDCIQPGFVPDDDLVLLYNAAAAFVLPYTYQTVSLPPLEAMACGTPVVTVGTPALREITGDAAHYVSAPDVSELAEALGAIAADPAYAESLAARGRAFVGGLSWRRTAAETLDVLAAAAA